MPSDQVGVFSGILGTADERFVLDRVILLRAPLLSTDRPRLNPPPAPPVNLRGQVGSSGLSIWMDGGRRPTTLLTNRLSPRSILTWIMCGPPERGLFSPPAEGEMGWSSCACIWEVLGRGERRVPSLPRASRTDLERWIRVCAPGLVLRVSSVVDVVVRRLAFGL